MKGKTSCVGLSSKGMVPHSPVASFRGGASQEPRYLCGLI